MNKIASLLIAIISTTTIFIACKKVDINNPPLPPYPPVADHSITMQLAQVAQVGNFTTSVKGDFSIAHPAFNLNGKNIKVSWGDGVDSLYPAGNPNVSVIAYHTYPRMGSYTVTITGDSLTSLDCTGNRNMNTGTSWTNTSNSFMETGVGHIVSLVVNKVPEMTSLNCSYNDITALATSVVDLPNLGNLVCSHNYRVGILPLANCTKLTNVDCSATSVSKLDVSNSPLLTNLACNEPLNGGKSIYGGANLRSLKLNNPVLTKINCSSNQIDSLDVTQCPALTSLDCSGNYALVSLKLNNPSLTTLSCGGGSSANFGGPSNLNTIDFSNVHALTTLTYAYTNAQTLSPSISTLTNLTQLIANSNAFTSVPDLSPLTKLTSIKLGFNNIASIDVAKLPVSVTFLDLSTNALTSLNVATLPKLASLYCGTNPMTSIDFTGYPALSTLDFTFASSLTSVTLPTTTTASSLTVYGNNCGLTSLTVPAFTKTLTLNCSTNPLTSITIPTTATGLKSLNCGNCKLTSFILPALTGLQGLTLDNNPFDDAAGGVDVSACTSLGLNFNNVSIKNCTTSGNKFKTIYAALASTTTSWGIDPGVTIVKK